MKQRKNALICAYNITLGATLAIFWTSKYFAIIAGCERTLLQYLTGCIFSFTFFPAINYLIHFFRIAAKFKASVFAQQILTAVIANTTFYILAITTLHCNYMILFFVLAAFSAQLLMIAAWFYPSISIKFLLAVIFPLWIITAFEFIDAVNYLDVLGVEMAKTEIIFFNLTFLLLFFCISGMLKKADILSEGLIKKSIQE